MSTLQEQILPPHDGLLPKWLLFISLVALGNTVQCYLGPSVTERVYNGSESLAKDKLAAPVNPLSARTFGTWTATSCIVRLYAAYNIDNPVVYQLAIWTFVIALAHFGSEWQVYGTARMGRGLAGPAIVSTSSLAWMFLQWGYYVDK